MYRVLTTAHLPRSVDGRFFHSYSCDATLIVVGVGGTGGYLAELAVQRAYAARHLYANPACPGWSCRIFLFDPDTVETRNVARQNFELADAGRAKVAAIGDRLLRRYAGTGLRVSANARRFGRDDLAAIAAREPSAQLWLFGCVDNAAGRRELHAAIAGLARRLPGSDSPPGVWYADCGNGFAAGQVALGNATESRQLAGAFDRASGTVASLPVPTWDEPTLLDADDGPATDEAEAYRRLDCATALELGFQDPGINGLVAAAAANLFFQALIGRLYARGARIDLDTCAMAPIQIEPREIACRCAVAEEALFADEDAPLHAEFAAGGAP